MTTKTLIAGVLLITLTACGDHAATASHEQASPANPMPVAHAKDKAAPSCPSQDFGTFITAFTDDVQIQQAFVHDPLESETVDVNADPEPKPVTRTLHKAELSFPLMPSTKEQTHVGLKRTISAIGPGEMQVKLAKDDTDYQLTFLFRNEGCWTLYRKQDDSL